MAEASRVATVTFAHLTDIGRVRARNEDFLGAFEPDDPEILRSRGRLLLPSPFGGEGEDGASLPRPFTGVR